MMPSHFRDNSCGVVNHIDVVTIAASEGIKPTCGIEAIVPRITN